MTCDATVGRDSPRTPARSPRPRAGKALSNLLIALAAATWLGGVIAAMAYQMRFERRPGATGSVPSDWPAGAALRLFPRRLTLVMAAHPHCPCTRASLEELAVIMSRAGSGMKAYVIFASPEGTGPDWAKTSLWEHAQAIPGVTAVLDPGGALARSFGLSTSGHVLCFSGQGRLRFSGGITSARGAEGPSAGREAILTLIRTGTSPCRRTPVYGCPLQGRSKEKS